MLTLRDPIQLHISQSLTGNAEAFGAKIIGNYSLLGARYTPKDLLFLLAAPPEPLEEGGGMTTLVDQHTNVDVRSVTLDVVNHVVNRILLEGTNQFTYQDQVYITSVLNRLGVTDVEQFMEQVRQLRVENESIVHMTGLYRQEVQRLLERQRAGEQVPGLPIPPAQEEEEERLAQDPRTALSMNILRRLDTANLYQKIHAYQHSWQGGENHFHHNELRLSEYLRFGNTVALSEIKQKLYQQPTMLLHRHINQYETGELLPPPQTEEQVLSQAAVSALVSAVDNTVVEVLNRPQFRRDQWLRLEHAVWQTAENALNRFESYHTEYNPPAQLHQAAAQQAWNEYTQQIQEYARLYQTLHPGEELRTLERIREGRSTPPMVHVQREKDREEAEKVPSLRQPGEPGERVLQERTERREWEKLWSSRSSVREILYRQESRLEAREKIRTQHPERVAEPAPPVREQAYPPAPPVTAFREEFREEKDRPPVPLTLREAEEQAPEILVEQLQRIDQQNRTVWQTVHEAARPRGGPPSRGPDLARTMRDGLRSLEAPELVLRELAERREQEPPAQTRFTPEEQALLRQAEPAARELYQRVLTYHKNPELALEQGLIRPAEMGGLQAALKGAAAAVMEHPQAPEQPELREIREESERVLQQVTRLTGRRAGAEPQRPEPPAAVKLVHKQQTSDVTEEMLERLENQRTQRTVQTENRDVVTRQNVHETDLTQVENKVVHQTTEDISELVNRTLARQMRTISDQVYRQMERRLQTERSRRGRL